MCGFVGKKLVHDDECSCDWEYDVQSDLELS